MQFVSVNGAVSKKQAISCGVPQGSILGPLLFLIYINDIIRCSHIMQFVLFADDTNIFFSSQSLAELENIINKELDHLAMWFKANKLSLNIDKTSYILFRNRGKKVKNNLNINIDGVNINQVTSAKFLGLYIDEQLTWTNHIRHISSKISKNIGIIRKLSYIVSQHVLTTLYHTLIKPYLTYCNIVWASNYLSRLKPLEILQKRIIRIVCSTDRLASTSVLFKQLNLLKLRDINIVQIAQFMYRYNHRLLPATFDNYFVLNSMVHEHNTRSSIRSKYHMPIVRTNNRKFSIKFSGPNTWNNTSYDMLSAIFLSNLKIKLSKLIISSY